jgi:FRG domain
MARRAQTLPASERLSGLTTILWLEIFLLLFMEQAGYSTIKCATWQEFKQYVERFSENWAFRGQANAQWVLNNAIERTAFIHLRKGIELEFLAEFERGARNYLTKDDTPEHLIEWLALMQHHGAPTRLLDLTRSPFVAAFFAFEQCLIKKDHAVAIWCVNVNFLKQRSLEVLSEEFGDEIRQNMNLINEKLFEKIFRDNNRNLVFPIEPFRMNRRYSLQQSVFISTGTSETPLMEQFSFLGDSLPKAVVKIELPTDHRREVLRDLQKMNLNRVSLFPDLDGYAAALRLRYESLRSPEEILEENLRKLEDEKYPFVP